MIRKAKEMDTIQKKNNTFDNLLPQKVLFSLKELEELGVAKVCTLKKFIYSGQITGITKIGNKIFLNRNLVCQLLEDFTTKEAFSYE